VQGQFYDITVALSVMLTRSLFRKLVPLGTIKRINAQGVAFQRNSRTHTSSNLSSRTFSGPRTKYGPDIRSRQLPWLRPRNDLRRLLHTHEVRNLLWGENRVLPATEMHAGSKFVHDERHLLSS